MVLTVERLDQASLNQLTSSPTAPFDTFRRLVAAIEAKKLDGVNLTSRARGAPTRPG